MLHYFYYYNFFLYYYNNDYYQLQIPSMDQRVFKRPWFSDDTWGVPPGLAPGPQQIRSLRIRGFERYGFAEMVWWASGGKTWPRTHLKDTRDLREIAL